jgi:hypothetical protein
MYVDLQRRIVASEGECDDGGRAECREDSIELLQSGADPPAVIEPDRLRQEHMYPRESERAHIPREPERAHIPRITRGAIRPWRQEQYIYRERESNIYRERESERAIYI